MEKYFTALQGISFKDWVKVKHTIDRCFDLQKEELNKNIQLRDEKILKEIKKSIFG